MTPDVMTTPFDNPAFVAEMNNAAHNVIAGHEQAPMEDAVALGAASLDAMDFTFNEADLDFLREAGINSDSLTGNLSAEENERLEAIDLASAAAAAAHFASQTEVAAAVQAADQHQAERAFVQHEIIDRDEAAKVAAKKKRSELALAA
ncbi:MAG TPA: hypothetical protein VLI54_03695 [Bacillota bacterium]|nr:hypothetical protein [Bacillota bacterium]